MNPETNYTYKKIAILDHMGYGNLGDAAIQDVVLENIKKRLPSAEIIAFSYEPDDTRKRHHVEAYPLHGIYVAHSNSENNDGDVYSESIKDRVKEILNKFPFIFKIVRGISGTIKELKNYIQSFKILKSVDLLIISGGGQLGDSYKKMPVTVFKFCLLAKLAKKKLIIQNVGAGPLNYFWTKKSAKWAAGLADYTSLRDEESQLLLKRLGVNSKLYVYPDSAYAYNLNGYQIGQTPKPSGTVVGFNPSGFCDPRIWPRKDEFVYRTYLDKITSFTFWLIRENYQVEIFTSDIGVDKFVIEDLRTIFSPELSVDQIHMIFPPVSKTTDQLIRQIAKFDFVITTKFHGIIFSHLLEKPVIALSWHHKNYDLMKAAGHEQYCLDIERFEVESLKKDFYSLVREADELKIKFRQKVCSNSRLLNSQFDQLFAKHSG